MSQLPQPAELPEQTRRIRGGVLATALPAPDGWQRGGLVVPWYGCGEPILRDKCIAGEDEAHRPVVATYPAFPIEQGSTCSTLSQLDHEAFARGRLDATTEWALGRQLATDIVGTGAPSLADAEVAGPYDDVVDAIACLEQCAADSGFGSEWFLHTSPRGAAYAKRYKMMDNQGFSPSGARWIISPGYPSGETTVRFWATGPVWAAVDAPDVHAAVDWRGNEDTAYALRSGVVAFDPCILCAVDVTVPECLVPVPPAPAILFPEDGATIPPLTPFYGRGCGPNEPVELWVAETPGAEGRMIDEGTTNANGAFNFVGTTEIAPGTHEFWVVCGGQESPRITVTVEDDETETLSFDWEVRTRFDDVSYVSFVIVSGTFPEGQYDQTASTGFALQPGLVGLPERNAPPEWLFGDRGLASDGGEYTWDVVGPYGIHWTTTGTGETTSADPITVDSGTVTYTRPVTP